MSQLVSNDFLSKKITAKAGVLEEGKCVLLLFFFITAASLRRLSVVEEQEKRENKGFL